MRIFVAVLFCMLFAHHESLGQKPLETSDPYEVEYFSCKGRPDGRLHNHAREQYGYSGFRIVADLNFDGRKDVILSTSDRNGGTGCGNAGCAVTVFKDLSILVLWG